MFPPLVFFEIVPAVPSMPAHINSDPAMCDWQEKSRIDFMLQA
jgi:hypothetical protein